MRTATEPTRKSFVSSRAEEKSIQFMEGRRDNARRPFFRDKKTGSSHSFIRRCRSERQRIFIPFASPCRFNLLFSKATANHCPRPRGLRRPIQPGATMSNRQTHHSDSCKHLCKLPPNIQMSVCLVVSVLRRMTPKREQLDGKENAKATSQK